MPVDTNSSEPVTFNGSCHCGAVKFTAELPYGLSSARRCTCSVCGIYTHHKRRSNPNQLGINVACLEGVSPFDFREVLVYDGQRHPGDDPMHTAYTAGVLLFEPVSDV